MKKSILTLGLSALIGTCSLFAQTPTLNGKINKKISIGEKAPEHRSCATQEPDDQWEQWFQQRMEEYKNSPESRSAAVYTIPVIVHILHNNTTVSTENISATQVASQITALNADFGSFNADTSKIPTWFKGAKAGDIGITFCLAQKDVNGNTLSEPGIDRINWATTTQFTGQDPSSLSDGSAVQTYFNGTVKPATIWNPAKYLNIWIADFANSGLLGYATFPAGTGLTGMSGTGSSTNDGVVIWTKSFGTTGYVTAPFNKGRTATHEIGHWLGLRHIGGDGNSNVSGDCAATDYCADTPPQKGGNSGGQYGQNYGCPTAGTKLHATGTLSCTAANPNGDMWQNYMDYVDDPCMYMFTANQKARIVTAMTNGTYRKTLTASASNLCPAASVAPTADFVGSPTSVVVGGTVTFTDQSTGSPTTWTWTATPSAGVSFSNANAQNPTATFANVGTYTIALTAANATGSNTMTKSSYITVTATATACDTINNIQAADTVSAYLLGTWGYFPGPNSYSMPAYAEKYTNTIVGTLSHVDVYPIQSDQRSTSGKVTFKVYSVNTSTGLPGTQLTNGSVQVAYSALTAGQLNTITFNPSVAITGDFFVSFEFTYGSPQDTLIMGLAFDGSNTSRVNTAYSKYNNTWYANDALLGSNSSMAMFAEVCPTITQFNDVKSIRNKVAVYPNPNNGMFSIITSFSKSTDLEIAVHDVVGRLVSKTTEHDITSKTFDMNLSNQTEGIYFVTVRSGDEQFTQKVSIVK